MDLLLFLFEIKKKKTKITHRLQLFCSHLQYANSVDKKYHKEKNEQALQENVEMGHASNPKRLEKHQPCEGPPRLLDSHTTCI